jgi:hypothetical protein
LSVVENREHGLKYLTPSAYPHFLLPSRLHLSLTDSAVDEPAEVPKLELPCWTVFLGMDRAVLNGPASPVFVVLSQLVGEKKQGLSLYMPGNSSPALLKALHGFDRCPQQLSNLALSFSQLTTDIRELTFSHNCPPFYRLPFRSKTAFTSLFHSLYQKQKRISNVD